MNHICSDCGTDIDTDEPDGWIASYQSNRNDTGIYTSKGLEMIAFANTPRRLCSN